VRASERLFKIDDRMALRQHAPSRLTHMCRYAR
jgi:hypothetical protein